MKLLFVSNLFPDSTEPSRGIYNARLVHHLADRAEVRVVAPRIMPFYKRGEPRQARPEDASLEPSFPRAPYLPKIGTRYNPWIMARTLRAPLHEARARFPFDAILVSWVYPDGCAVAQLADEMGVPFVVVAQGSDIHQYLSIRARRPMILSALSRASAVVTRSQDLTRRLREAGLAADKLHVIYNGVDRERFHPGDREAARAALGWRAEGRVILYVGNLVPVKNPLLLIDAFLHTRGLPDARLIMIGGGPLEAEARGRAAASRGRIELLGKRKEAEVAECMRAADVLCVPSDNEGVPNVILEAFASGLPVVATRVGGIPEIVTSDALGLLVERRNVAALADALEHTLRRPPASEAILAHAEHFSWPSAAESYLALFEARR